MSAPIGTCAVEVESLSPGEKIVAPDGEVWLLLPRQRPTDPSEEQRRVRLIPFSDDGGVEITRLDACSP